MYIPATMAMPDTDTKQDFIDQFSFGVLVSESLNATHLPFQLERDEGQLGSLYCHFARANPHWQQLDGKQVLVIFSGPHAYISPRWYANHPAVPTWNYAAVHVQGTLQLLGEEETLQVVQRAVSQYEPELLEDPGIMDPQYNQRLSKAVVAAKIQIIAMDGKLKLGQHKQAADQLGVVQGLGGADNHSARALLDYMRRIGIGTGA